MKAHLFDRVEAHHKQLLNAKNGGFRQWEHCYNYFDPQNEGFNEDVACLHLTSYLACWGMYRSSAFIKSVDAQFHKPVIREIRKKEYEVLRGLPINASDDLQSKAYDLYKALTNIYHSKMDRAKANLFSPLQKNTDTLVTKVLLGTLACTPAYDRFFREGLKIEGLKNNPKIYKNFRAIFAEANNLETLEKIKNLDVKFSSSETEPKLNTDPRSYPDLKIIDSYYHLVGWKPELPKKKEKIENDLKELRRSAANNEVSSKQIKIDSLNEKLEHINGKLKVLER